MAKATRKLGREFYRRPALELAPDLLGKILVRRFGKRRRRARIVETEAYVGEHDLACHASKGRTRRTEIMFGPGGHAYIYLIYGMYTMFNVVASVAGDAQAVLIRAGEPLDGWHADLSGPGKLARAFELTLDENGLDLTGDNFYFVGESERVARIVASKRVGVDYAKEWKEALLRFCDADSKAVSKPLPTAVQASKLKAPSCTRKK